MCRCKIRCGRWRTPPGGPYWSCCGTDAKAPENWRPAGEITAHFSVSAPAISRHLSVLKEADLIRDDRRGKFIFYELNASVLEEILLWLTRLKGDEQHVENP